jgi:hypothetical protein
VKTADPIGRFRDHSYPVRQGIFNRGNISDSQLLINLFFVFTKNAPLGTKNRLSLKIIAQNNPKNRTIPTQFLWTSQSLQIQ